MFFLNKTLLAKQWLAWISALLYLMKTMNFSAFRSQSNLIVFLVGTSRREQICGISSSLECVPVDSSRHCLVSVDTGTFTFCHSTSASRWLGLYCFLSSHTLNAQLMKILVLQCSSSEAYSWTLQYYTWNLIRSRLSLLFVVVVVVVVNVSSII